MYSWKDASQSTMSSRLSLYISLRSPVAGSVLLLQLIHTRVETSTVSLYD